MLLFIINIFSKNYKIKDLLIIYKFIFAVYYYLDSNREEFNNYNFEYDGKIIASDKYIDIIKNILNYYKRNI